MVQLQRDEQARLLNFHGREDGYEIVFDDKPVAVLRMRRRPIEGQEAWKESDLADMASAQAADGEWIFETLDVTQGIQILDLKSDTELGVYRRLDSAGKIIGELRLSSGENFQWMLVEADPNQVSAQIGRAH